MVIEYTEEECAFGTSKQAPFNFKVEPLFHRASNAFQDPKQYSTFILG